MRITSAPQSEEAAASRLRAVLRRAPLAMEALRVARDVDAPDWLLSAGAIREVVWDDAHGRPLTAMPRDVDIGFFDPTDLTPRARRGRRIGPA